MLRELDLFESFLETTAKNDRAWEESERLRKAMQRPVPPKAREVYDGYFPEWAVWPIVIVAGIVMLAHIWISWASA